MQRWRRRRTSETKSKREKNKNRSINTHTRTCGQIKRHAHVHVHTYSSRQSGPARGGGTSGGRSFSQSRLPPERAKREAWRREKAGESNVANPSGDASTSGLAEIVTPPRVHRKGPILAATIHTILPTDTDTHQRHALLTRAVCPPKVLKFVPPGRLMATLGYSPAHRTLDRRDTSRLLLLQGFPLRFGRSEQQEAGSGKEAGRSGAKRGARSAYAWEGAVGEGRKESTRTAATN